MTNFDLLSAVQPVDGWFAICGLKNGMRQELVATREEADQVIANYLAQERDVYFGVAKYKTAAGRSKENVASLRAFWLDLDCGAAKAEINKKTGKPNGYIDQQTALLDLQRFCKTTGLPRPIIVNSGRGIHVYWPLTEDISREEWEFVATKLHALCIAHDLYADAAVFEVARILRVPGTLNFKDSPPTPVEVIATGRPVSLAAFKVTLGITVSPAPAAPKRELTELGKLMQENMVSSFNKIMVRSTNGNGCGQLLDCYKNQDVISEPRWFNALSVAKFCVDADTAIHRMSAKHPDYDAATTVTKIQHIVGPHTCDVFERNNPGGCDSCPFKGKIKSPIVLGKEILEGNGEANIVSVADEEGEDDKTYTIPKYPYPYFRGENGGIYVKPFKGDEETEPMLVYPHDLYVVKRMRDPVLGDVVILRVHMPQDGVKEFMVPNRTIADKGEFRKTLAAEGVMGSDKTFTLVLTYLNTAINELQFKKKAEKMRLQFGWADNDSKFIIGDREVSKSGTFHSPPSSITSSLAAQMVPTGSFEKWKEVFNLYGREGLEPHAFAALSAFGAPLLKFTGQKGAIINLLHSSSGTGKTTALHMLNSVWGSPDRLCAVKDDTLNAKIMRLGVMNNLPYSIDEMTNTDPKEFSVLAYNMSQGRGKDRVKQSANEMRENLTSWSTISICSSNASFYEKLTALKGSPDGEMMRLIEYKIDYSDAIDASTAKYMFDHQLMENYGWAGEKYAQWLVNNLEEAKKTCLEIQAKLDRELKLTPRERFWSAVVAANITGGLIALKLGLIDWDMKRLYKWACEMLTGLRADVAPPATDAATIIGDYINRHMQNILVVNDKVDMRSQMPSLPQLEPRGELIIRFEPDTKRMFLSAKAFKDDCVKFQVNYRDTLKRLGDVGIYTGTAVKRLSKGMKVASPAVYCLQIDCSGKDFISVDEFVKAADASGEG
jgi:hypothetical protein